MRLQRRFIDILSLAGTALCLASAATSARAQGPQTAGDAHAGQKEYKRYCVGCHGPKGNGSGENAQWIEPKPRDFTEAIFKCRSTPTGTLPTDADLEHSITRGFVSTNMPPWRALTAETRVNLVAYIKTFSSRWVTERPGTPLVEPPEPEPTVKSILHGRELYQKVECWKCHGPAGEGNGPAASALTDSKDNPIRPYNFTSGSRFKCGQTNADLYKIFMTGVDGTPMPSFADNLTPPDAWDLVHFLRTLQPQESPEATLWKSWYQTHSAELAPIGPGKTAP